MTQFQVCIFGFTDTFTAVTDDTSHVLLRAGDGCVCVKQENRTDHTEKVKIPLIPAMSACVQVQFHFEFIPIHLNGVCVCVCAECVNGVYMLLVYTTPTVTHLCVLRII